MVMMTYPNDKIKLTECPAADSDFDFSGYLNTCRVCIAGNAEVAGLGVCDEEYFNVDTMSYLALQFIVTGIFLQAILMNAFVFFWWVVGPGFDRIRNDFRDVFQWCIRAVGVVFCQSHSIWGNIKVAWTLLRKDFDRFGENIRAAAGPENAELEDISEGNPIAVSVDPLPAEHSDVKGVVVPADPLIGNNVEDAKSSHRNRKILQKMFRTFSDTQVVTGIALLLAALVQDNDLSLYHTAILIDLISISADGQAIMLFYSYRNFSVDTPFAPLRADRGIRARLLSSAIFLALYFVFVFKQYFRYRDSEECYLFTPIGRNSGAWGIATAVLVLVVYLPIFIPRRWQEWSIKSGGNIVKRSLAFFYNNDLDRIADNEGAQLPKKGLKEKLISFCYGLRRVLAWMIYAVGKMVRWLYRRELSFPIATWAYFIANAIDVRRLQQLNIVLLVDGGEEEKNFGAFGQIVPIVMGAALAFPIYDVLQESLTG